MSCPGLADLGPGSLHPSRPGPASRPPVLCSVPIFSRVSLLQPESPSLRTWHFVTTIEIVSCRAKDPFSAVRLCRAAQPSLDTIQRLGMAACQPCLCLRSVNRMIAYELDSSGVVNCNCMRTSRNKVCQCLPRNIQFS